MRDSGEASRATLGFSSASLGAAVGNAAGGWVAYLLLPGAPVLVAAWVGCAFGAGFGVATTRHGGAVMSALGAATVWPLAAYVGWIPVLWIGKLLSIHGGSGAPLVLATVAGLTIGALAGFAGRVLGWGVGHAVSGFGDG